jgi:hypothetical protein
MSDPPANHTRSRSRSRPGSPESRAHSPSVLPVSQVEPSNTVTVTVEPSTAFTATSSSSVPSSSSDTFPTTSTHLSMSTPIYSDNDAGLKRNDMFTPHTGNSVDRLIKLLTEQNLEQRHQISSVATRMDSLINEFNDYKLTKNENIVSPPMGMLPQTPLPLHNPNTSEQSFHRIPHGAASATNNVKSSPSRSHHRYYAVAAGRTPGVYQDWPSCEEQVKQYSGAVYKGFKHRLGAELFVDIGQQLIMEKGYNYGNSNSYHPPDSFKLYGDIIKMLQQIYDEDNNVKVNSQRAHPGSNSPVRSSVKNDSVLPKLEKVHYSHDITRPTTATHSNDNSSNTKSVLGEQVFADFDVGLRTLMQMTRDGRSELSERDRIKARQDVESKLSTFRGDRDKAPEFYLNFVMEVERYPFNANDCMTILRSKLKGEAMEWLVSLTVSGLFSLPEHDRMPTVLQAFKSQYMNATQVESIRSDLNNIKLPEGRVTLSDLKQHYQLFVNKMNALRVSDPKVTTATFKQMFWNSLSPPILQFIGNDFNNLRDVDAMYQSAETAVKALTKNTKPQITITNVNALYTRSDKRSSSSSRSPSSSSSSSSSSSLTSEQRAYNIDYNKVACFHCGSKGHFMYNCDLRKDGVPQNASGARAWSEYCSSRGELKVYDPNRLPKSSRSSTAAAVASTPTPASSSSSFSSSSSSNRGNPRGRPRTPRSVLTRASSPKLKPKEASAIDSADESE